jgi:enamine deaminase RidA (YjgF/YER057c/UK114 family)
MRAECAERDSRGERERGNEQADLGVHQGPERGRCAQFVYNDALALICGAPSGSGKDSTMTIQRHHVGKRLADIVVHGGTIYLAGQVADDLNADITTQARQVLARIDRLLAEAGSGKDRMLSATIYLPDMADFAAMNAVWEAWIVPGQAPARATVQAKLAASGYKIEIQVIAAQQPVRS